MSGTRKQVLAAIAVVVLAGGLIFVTPTEGMPEDPQQMDQFISLMDNYLSLSGRFVEMVERPESASYLALEGIVEIYEQQGRKGDAIAHLQRVLEEEADSRAVRNAVLFKLRDLHKERGDAAEALAQLDRILRENAG